MKFIALVKHRIILNWIFTRLIYWKNDCMPYWNITNRTWIVYSAVLRNVFLLILNNKSIAFCEIYTNITYLQDTYPMLFSNTLQFCNYYRNICLKLNLYLFLCSFLFTYFFSHLHKISINWLYSVHKYNYVQSIYLLYED